MRINNNITALNTFNQYTKNTGAASKSMEKLSSGYRINKAADDAAGLSISEKMRSQIAGLDQSQRNVADGVSLLQTAEGALEEVSDMLVRMKELVVEKENGTYSTADEANINAELDALGDAIDEITTTTDFNGIDVFGDATNIVYGANGENTTTIAAAVLTGVTGLSSSATSTSIETAITAVNTQRAVYGAQQNKLEHVANNLSTTSENISAAESNIRNVDMASEMSEFTKNNILIQASTSMLAQANAMPQNVLSLLQ